MDITFTYKNICRVCLEEGANLSLFDDEEEVHLYIKIMACSTVQICKEDGFPNNICPVCYSMLNTAFEFKQKCENSDHKLRNYVEKDIVKTEEEDYAYPVDDLFTGAYLSEEDVKNFDSSDDLKVFPPEKVKEEVKVHKKKLNKKKKKWKVAEKRTLRVRKDTPLPNIIISKNKNVSNRIATSLLEGTCIWNGRDWRFKDFAEEISEETKKELEELPKLMKERDELKRTKKNRRKLSKKEKSTINLCDTCGQIFTSRYHLKYHIMIKHLDTTPTTVKCKDPSCKKIFKHHHYMERHLKRCHSTRREFICNECGKQYAFISGLRQHMKIHSGIQVWKHCTFCTQKYRTQKSVEIHIRSVHTGERPSVCTMCDSAFFHDDYLKEHMRLHTGETPFKCPICKRGYAQRGNMKSHMKQHRMSELDDTMKATMKPNYLKLLRDC